MIKSTYTSSASLASHLISRTLLTRGHKVRPISGKLGEGEHRLLAGEHLLQPLDGTRPGRLFDLEVWDVDAAGRQIVRLELAIVLRTPDEFTYRIDGDPEIVEHTVSCLEFCRDLWASGFRAVTREAPRGE